MFLICISILFFFVILYRGSQCPVRGYFIFSFLCSLNRIECWFVYLYILILYGKITTLVIANIHFITLSTQVSMCVLYSVGARFGPVEQSCTTNKANTYPQAWISLRFARQICFDTQFKSCLLWDMASQTRPSAAESDCNHMSNAIKKINTDVEWMKHLRLSICVKYFFLLLTHT